MQKIKKLIRFVPAMLWYLLIWSMSAQPAAQSGNTSGSTIGTLLTLIGTDYARLSAGVQITVVELLSFYVRKGAHMFLFFVLAFLLWYGFAALIGNRPRRALCAAGFCAILAALDEYHQTLVPGRSGEMRDVLVDLSGSLIALLILALPAISLWLQEKMSHPERLWWGGAVCGAALLLYTGTLTGLAPLFVSRIALSPVLTALSEETLSEYLLLAAPVTRQTLYLFFCAASAFLSTCLAVLSGNRRAVILSLVTVCTLSLASGLLWGLPVIHGIALCLVGSAIALLLRCLFPLLKK